MSDFKWFCSLMILLCVGCSNNSPYSPLKSSGYTIQFDDDPLNKKWGNYLYKHLSKRAKKRGIVHLQHEKNNFMNVKIHIDKNVSHDYIIECSDKQLLLQTRDEDTMLWLIYQFMEELSTNDIRFTGDDLPPAILDFHSRTTNFDFSYREPHFSPNTENDDYGPIIGTNNVDRNWGIWGHNLKKIVTEDNKKDIYAKQSGKIIYEQYCFSSDEIYNQLEEYIINNYGDSKEYKQGFMIMPNDNNIVCDCGKCLMNGNTSDNATPALSMLIKRLASRFPYHSFFTSAYLTTKTSPDYKWPENTGVMISTIDIPKGVSLNNQNEVKSFLNILNNWKKNVSTIYIWDYAANFDDYLTPIPVLYGLKKQLKFYKSVGVKGIFLNAGGYDYSSFDDMKTYVCANLMIDSSLSVDTLCRLYFDKFYPKTGKMLSDYYLSLEKELEKNGKPYNIYAGFKEMTNAFFNIDDFVVFYNFINSQIPHVEEDEKRRLNKLLVALTFTRLQIAYESRSSLYGFATEKGKQLIIKPEIRVFINKLSQYIKFENFLNYKEDKGSLDLYIENWNRMLGLKLENKLMNEPIEVLPKQDLRNKTINKLNDGVVGFAEDYHQGWQLNEDDLHIRINTDNIKHAKKITFTFLFNKRHQIYPPDEILIYKNHVKYREITIVNDNNQDRPQILTETTDINFADANDLEIRIVKSKNKKLFACDEIWLN